MHAFEQLINLLAPHRCISCLAEGTLLCDSCSASVIPAPACCFKCGKAAVQYLCETCSEATDIDALTIAATYRALGKTLVHRLKFERARAAARPMAQLLAQHLPRQRSIIVPIPTATRRVRQRGYDQATLIAKELSRLTGLPYCPLLRRVTATRQLGQSRGVRRAQLQHAFVVRRKAFEAPPAVLLIDDVITTGSTVEAAATTLRAAGFQQIAAAIFAAA